MNLATTGREGPTNPTNAELAGAKVSGGLEWLWDRLRDNPSPHVLHCGPPLESTVNVLAGCSTRVYIGDLITAARRRDGELWDHSGEAPVFRTERLLSELPAIRPGSISAVFCWQLLDLLPRQALADVVRRIYLYLEPDSVVFFLLREPQLKTGADTTWYLETPTRFATRALGQSPFQHPPLSNREMERLIPAGIAKTFLRRGGLREVLAIK